MKTKLNEIGRRELEEASIEWKPNGRGVSICSLLLSKLSGNGDECERGTMLVAIPRRGRGKTKKETKRKRGPNLVERLFSNF